MTFIFSQPINLYVLIGSHSAGELKESMAALELQLTQAEVDWLDLRSDSR